MQFVAVAVSPLTARAGWGTVGSEDGATQIALASCAAVTGDVCQMASGTATVGAVGPSQKPNNGLTVSLGLVPRSPGVMASSDPMYGHTTPSPVRSRSARWCRGRLSVPVESCAVSSGLASATMQIGHLGVPVKANGGKSLDPRLNRGSARRPW